MNASELREKLEKAQANVKKIENTIEKHQKQAEKKLSIIRANNWNENDRYAMQDTPEYHESYWAVCEYDNKLEDIENASKKLEDAIRVAANWKVKLEEAEKNKMIILKEIPEVLKRFIKELAQDWAEYDIKQREAMKKKRSELDYKEFSKLYTYEQYEKLNRTDEEFHKMALADAEFLVLDLNYRVKKITGEITDWSNVHYGGKALNGFVKGEKAKAEVRSILAGGYNIQKLHIRVLVKKI